MVRLANGRDFHQRTVLSSISEESEELLGGRSLDVASILISLDLNSSLYRAVEAEGKKYLFGPGVSDHIPGQGFGQMGMGVGSLALSRGRGLELSSWCS